MGGSERPRPMSRRRMPKPLRILKPRRRRKLWSVRGLLGATCLALAILAMDLWRFMLELRTLAFVVPLAAYLGFLIVTNLEPADWPTTAAQMAAGLMAGITWGLLGAMSWDLALSLGALLAVIAPFSDSWIEGL